MKAVVAEIFEIDQTDAVSIQKAFVKCFSKVLVVQGQAKFLLASRRGLLFPAVPINNPLRSR